MGYRFVVRSRFALPHAALLSPPFSHKRHTRAVPPRWRALGVALALLLGSAAGFMLHAQTAQPGQTAVNFGNVAIGSPGSPTSVTFTFTSGGSGITTSVVTQGAKGLDFTNAGGGTCDTNGSNYTYNTGDSCTVNVAFTPKYAGTRYGAAELLNGSDTVIATALTYGTGLGPQLISGTGLARLGGGFNSTRSLAVDGNSNIYVVDGSVVKEIPPGCTSATCVTTVGGGFNSPSHVAVDGAANIYVSDSANNAIYEMPQGCVSSGCVRSVGNFNTPLDVAVDGNGNLYVVESAATTVTEVPPGCTSTSCETLLGGGFVNPGSLAVDPGGNVYVAENNTLKKMPPGCTSSSCVVVVLPDFKDAGINDVAVDGRGEVYLTSHVGVFEMAPDCASLSCVMNVGGTEQNFSVAVDGAGNVYFTAISPYWVLEEMRSSLPTQLSFSALWGNGQGAAVYLRNIGNAPLTFPVPATGQNPSVSAPFTISPYNTCPVVTPSSSPGTLAAGASCYVDVQLVPTSIGTFTGTLEFTDNSLNVSTTQSVALTATLYTSYGAPRVTVTPLLSGVLTTIQPLSVTVAVSPFYTNVAWPTPTGSVTLSSGSYTSAVTTLSSGSVTINIPAGQLAPGSDTLTATYTPDSSSYNLYDTATGAAPLTVEQEIGSCSNPNPNPNPTSFANPGDFDGDCKSDILWRNSSSGQLYTWLMNGATSTSQQSPGTVAAIWNIVGEGDFDGDGKADILWRNRSTGQLYIWFMNGATVTSQQTPGTVAPVWNIVGIGDFDGDGKADILWQNSSTGQVYLWLMNGTTMTSQTPGFVTSGWNVVGLGDFNGDGRADILWRNSSTGQLYLWFMNGSTITSGQSPGTVAAIWNIVGIGDVDGDGKSDIVWRNSSTGQLYLWFMNGATSASQQSPGTVATVWSIVGTGDFDGDGKADFLWRNSSTGELYLWLMNGNSITSQTSLGTVSTDWQIVAQAPSP